MPITNREQLITVLGRLTASTDKPTVINALVEWLHFAGYDDVADAFITALNATSTVLSTTLNQTLITQAKSRNSSGRTQHERS